MTFKTCPKCGREELYHYSKFCAYCGTPIQDNPKEGKQEMKDPLDEPVTQEIWENGKKVGEFQIKSYNEIKMHLVATMAENGRLRRVIAVLKKSLSGSCGNERPNRKIFCQLPKDHENSHQAVIFWEDELQDKNKEEKGGE